MSFIMPNRKDQPNRLQTSGALDATDVSDERFQIVTLLDGGEHVEWITAMFEACAAMAPDDLDLVPVEIGDLPSFHAGDAAGSDQPPAVTAFTGAVESADGFLLIADGDQGALSEPLSRAVQWAGQPEGADALNGLAVVMLVAGTDVAPVDRVRQQCHQLMAAAGADLAAVANDATIIIPAAFDDRATLVDIAGRQEIGRLLMALRGRLANNDEEDAG